MALTPGGGQPPSTLDKPPSPPTRGAPARPPRGSRGPRWPRSASVAVVRLGALIGGIVIILDLLFMLLMERSVNADDITAFVQLDLMLNVILFSILGVLVVRQTSIMLSGAVAGLFAAVLDAIVVTAASLMVPPPPPLDSLGAQVAQNLIIGTVFAGLSGVVFAVVGRWSGGQRR